MCLWGSRYPIGSAQFAFGAILGSGKQKRDRFVSDTTDTEFCIKPDQYCMRMQMLGTTDAGSQTRLILVELDTKFSVSCHRSKHHPKENASWYSTQWKDRNPEVEEPMTNPTHWTLNFRSVFCLFFELASPSRAGDYLCLKWWTTERTLWFVHFVATQTYSNYTCDGVCGSKENTNNCEVLL